MGQLPVVVLPLWDSYQWWFSPYGTATSGGSPPMGQLPVVVLPLWDSYQWWFSPYGTAPSSGSAPMRQLPVVILPLWDSYQWWFCPYGTACSLLCSMQAWTYNTWYIYNITASSSTPLVSPHCVLWPAHFHLQLEIGERMSQSSYKFSLR